MEPRVELVRCPEEALERLHMRWRREPWMFWLDSGGPSPLARWSFMGARPYMRIEARGRRIRAWSNGEGDASYEADPFDALAAALEPVFAQTPPEGFPPFCGGAVAVLGYGLRHFAERLPRRERPDLGLPDLSAAFYDALVAYDRREGAAWLIATGLPLQGGAAAVRAQARLHWLRAELEAALEEPEPEPPALPADAAASSAWRRTAGEPAGLEPTISRERYLRAVEQTKAHIAAGEIYQANLSQRFSLDVAQPPWSLYRILRRVNPAPFAAYLPCGNARLLSVSPERFLLMDGSTVETRPIKGTRPRGEDAEAEAALRADLSSSPKDRAEHVMIVDVERADLGRFCLPGTVHVPELFACEAHPTVLHMVSTVQGRLPDGADRIACIRSAFPGGSITGAPKARAMEIIDELEPVERGPYTGAIGYLGAGGRIDLNVAIRTVTVQEGRAHFHVGGGIVADSDPEEEYEETLDKAEGLARALLAARPR